MQVVFRFNGSEEIVVSNQVDGVMVETYKGIEPGYHGDASAGAHYMTECSQTRCGENPASERQRAVLTLSKSGARAVASAIMGAAAEL